MPEQLSLFHVVHSHIVVVNDAREEVVNLTCHVQDIADAATCKVRFKVTRVKKIAIQGTP